MGPCVKNPPGKHGVSTATHLERWCRAAFCVVLCSLVGIATAEAATTKAETVHRSQATPRAFQQSNPCPSTGKTTGACPGFIKDHVIPLCKGGPDTAANLQWQTTAAAKEKDRVECK